MRAILILKSTFAKMILQQRHFSLIFVLCLLIPLLQHCETVSQETKVNVTPLQDTKDESIDIASGSRTKIRAPLYCTSKKEEALKYLDAANSLLAKGQWAESKKLFLKALEIDPNFCDAMDNLGLLLRRQGKIDEAVSWYKKSISILFYNPIAHLNLASAYQIQGKKEEALSEYQSVINFDPENPEGYHGAGLILLILNRPQEAITKFHKAEVLYEKSLSPLVTHSRYGLGVAYYLLENCKKAIYYLNSAISTDEGKNDPLLNFYLGNCYLSNETRDIELAKKHIKKAQSLGVRIPFETSNALGMLPQKRP